MHTPAWVPPKMRGLIDVQNLVTPSAHIQAVVSRLTEAVDCSLAETLLPRVPEEILWFSCGSPTVSSCGVVYSINRQHTSSDDVDVSRGDGRMICLEVRVNAQPYCVAGVGDVGSLRALISWRYNPLIDDVSGVMGVMVFGTTAEAQELSWGDGLRYLQVGDTVTVRLIECETPTPPRE